MVDYISAKNYKILSDKELIEWQNETKNKRKELQNRLLNINRAIKNRKIGNIDMENKQMKCIKGESCLHCGSNYCRFVDELEQLKTENEKLKEELSVIQHNCSREGCKYYDDDTFKVFYECKAQKALQLSANSVTTKYCDLLKILTEIKEIIKQGVKIHDDIIVSKQILQKISECEVENDNK